MATAVQKITLSPSRDIPFNKLVLSQSNVRRMKGGVSVEELAEDPPRACCRASAFDLSSTRLAWRLARLRSRPAAGASGRWSCW
jgi:hypothetical protein